MLILSNGSEPLMWNVQSGKKGKRNYIGTVLAKWTRGIHPYVVWNMSSEDGSKWNCEAGAYCDSLNEAGKIFAERAETQVDRRVSWLEQIEETTNTKEVTSNE